MKWRGDFRIRILAALSLLMGLAGACGIGLWHSLTAPYAGFPGEVFVDIPRRTGTIAMARLLEKEGVVRHSWQFVLARAFSPRRTLHAGEYRFHRPASTLEVLERIASGDVHHYAITVPEGSNIFDIAAIVDKIPFLSGKRFLRAAGDPSPVRDLAPAAPTLEGFLFPSTYNVPRNTTEAELCALMTRQFRKVWNSLGASRDVQQVVTLASLVEKESALAEERPLVASVFANRLRLGMKLDCDPTTIYAALLEGRYRGTIYRSDLNSKHAYNTYQHTGLPPGPIANPGLEALRAAMNPARTDYLYFVAQPDGSGAHQFSRTHAEHQRAVRKYRLGTRQNQQKASSGGMAATAASAGHR